MAKELSMIAVRPIAVKEEGFVLATSLVLLLLLTMLAVGVMYSGNVSQQTSATARDTTEAFYYAETGIHYITWALKNDAEFDSFPGPPEVVKRSSGDGGVFQEATLPSAADPVAVAAAAAVAITVGDRYELFANLSYPGPTAISDTSDQGTCNKTVNPDYQCQVMYFDNRLLASRTNAICWGGGLCPGTSNPPTFDGINQNLPRYIKLEIDASGNVTPTIPALLASPGQPYHGTVVGTDVPNNGVIVWITAGDATEDAEILPSSACSGITNGQSCYQGATAASPTAVNSYNIVAYAIGYVNGKALRMIRAVVM